MHWIKKLQYLGAMVPPHMTYLDFAKASKQFIGILFIVTLRRIIIYHAQSILLRPQFNENRSINDPR